MEKRRKRLGRLLEMILLIQSRPDWRPRKLAEHFGISETRIYHDIRELVAAGLPIYFAGGGYRLAGGSVLGSARLSASEVVELLYPKHLFADDGLPQPSETLLEAKLAACLPEPLRGSLGSGFERSRIRLASSTRRTPHFQRLHDAIAERRRVLIRYASRASGRTMDREVDPYALIFRRHSWYLVAKCQLRREVRKFRLSRIQSVGTTPLHFAEPKDFSLEDYTAGWWEVFGGPPANVAVRFTRRVADLIRDQAPRMGQTIQELPGGDVIYRVRVRGIQEIAWWIMQYGADAEALEPAELRDFIRTHAERMVRLYARVAHEPALGKVAEHAAPYTAGRS